MAQPAEPEPEQDDVQYQFKVDKQQWDAWKRTVPRTKSLRQRIIELIEADTEDNR